MVQRPSSVCPVSPAARGHMPGWVAVGPSLATLEPTETADGPGGGGEWAMYVCEGGQCDG